MTHRFRDSSTVIATKASLYFSLSLGSLHITSFTAIRNSSVNEMQVFLLLLLLFATQKHDEREINIQTDNQ